MDTQQLDPERGVAGILLENQTREEREFTRRNNPTKTITDDKYFQKRSYTYDKEGHFTEYWGSNMWPSIDPLDVPFNKYTCNHCGYSFVSQVCGVSETGKALPLAVDVWALIRDHLTSVHNIKEVMI